MLYIDLYERNLKLRHYIRTGKYKKQNIYGHKVDFTEIENILFWK